MDIETKKFRLKRSATCPGKAELIMKNQGMGPMKFIDLACLPGANALAIMHELTFDREMSKLWNNA